MAASVGPGRAGRGALPGESDAPSIRANDAIELVFHETGEKRSEIFQPLFTHQLFPSEKIMGYRAFKLRLNYTAGSLFPLIEVPVKDPLPIARLPTEMDAANGVPMPPPLPKTTNVEEILSKHLGIDPLLSRSEWEEKLEAEAYWRPNFCSSLENPLVVYRLPPPATLRSGGLPEPVSDCPDGDQFVIMKENLAGNAGLRMYHKRLQFLMFMSIDSASYIDDQDERWELFLVYHKEPVASPKYKLVGYSTVYPFSAYEKSTKRFRERLRISQFLILPQYRRGGHGGRLLSAIYQAALCAEIDALEVTIEDPSEGFRKMRDLADLRGCLSAKLLNSDPRNEAIQELSATKLEAVRDKLRITKAQAKRCHEINLLRGLAGPAGGVVASGVNGPSGGALGLNPDDLERKKKYRLMVKRRLYLEFEEILAPLDPEERKCRLVELYDDLEKEYVSVAKKIPLKRKRMI